MQEKLEKLFLIKSTIFESPFMAHFEDLVICLLTNNNNILELSSILAKHLSMYLILNPQSRNPITRLKQLSLIKRWTNETFFSLFFSWISCPISIGKIVSWHARCLKICKNSDNFASATYEKGYNLPFFFKSTHSKVGDWTGICAKKDFFIIVYG